MTDHIMTNANTLLQHRSYRRRFAQIAGLMTLALVAGIVSRMYMDFQDFAQDRMVEVGASYKPYADVVDMTRSADIVVVGRVVGEGKTHFVTQAIERPRPFQAPATSDPKSEAALVKEQLAATDKVNPAAVDKQSLAPAAPASQPSAASSGQFDLPVTEFTVAIERVVHGTAKGSELTVSQPGGTVRTPTFPGGPQITRTVQFEHDPPFKSNERQLLFLRDAGDGTYYVVGGPQGRLRIDNGDTVHVIDHAAPAVRGRDGARVADLLAEVAAVR